MTLTRNTRGFLEAPTITDAREGTARVVQSSAAVCEGDAVQSGCVWLFVTDRAHDRRGMVQAALHLSHEQALELAEALQSVVREVEEAR